MYVCVLVTVGLCLPGCVHLQSVVGWFEEEEGKERIRGRVSDIEQDERGRGRRESQGKTREVEERREGQGILLGVGDNQIIPCTGC